MRIAFILLLLIEICSCTSTQRSTAIVPVTYIPDDKNLYDTIVKLDSIFFNAYNTCAVNLETYASFYAEDVEFYHDKGGVMNSKEDIVASTKKNVCGKVTRKLVNGSIEVYPIKDYGAVEIGYHTFHNNTEKEDRTPHPGRFVIIWHHTPNAWKIARVISLH